MLGILFTQGLQIINNFYCQKYTMSDFSSIHLRNINIQNIVLQNQELRRHLQHYVQNQHLLEELTLKLESCKSKELQLLNANSSLNELLKKQQSMSVEREKTYSEQMQYVFVQHDKILATKDQQLHYLKQELAKVTQRMLESEETARVNQDRERQLNQRYEHQLTKYKSNILEFETEIQALYRNNQNDKYNFQLAKSNWAKERQNQLSQILKLTDALKKKEEDNCLFLDYSKQLQFNLVKIEQQHRSTLVELRDRLIHQQQQIQQYLYLNRQLQSNSQIITRQLEELKRLQAHLSNDNHSLAQQKERLITLLNESHREIQLARSQITQLEIQINRIKQSTEFQLQDLKAQNIQLLRSKTQAESYINSKMMQLREVSGSANSLQMLASKQQMHIQNLNQSLKDVEQYLVKEKKRTNELSIQLKEQHDSREIIKQQNSRLQEINNKLQQQIHELSNQTITLSKNLVNPRDLNKQFVDQINKMLAKFRQEREQQNRYNLLQKQKLKERYQFQMKQLQLNLLKKISLLQQQVAIYHKCEILSQRNSNIYTYTLK